MSHYQPIAFKPWDYLIQGGPNRRFMLYWLLGCLLVVPSGMLTRVFELTGLTLQIFGLDVHITVYLPMLLCLPVCLMFGYFWAAIPAYFSTFLVAIIGDMPLGWILLFSFANPIGLAMLVLIYKMAPVKHDLHGLNAVLVFTVAAFLSSLSGSIGSFIWTYTNQVNMHDFFRVWQGWWLGGFIQAMLFCAPILYVFSEPASRYKNQSFPAAVANHNSRKTVRSAIVLITFVLIGFTWLAFQVGVMNIKDHINLINDVQIKSELLTALQVIEFPTMIYVIILALIGYFAFYFINYWTLRLEGVNLALKEQNDQLYQSSITDNLTQAHNRTYLFAKLPGIITRMKNQQGKLAIALLDLDHFKQINDQYGHQAGDQVLKTFSALVAKTINCDQLFARFGGEEFILVVPDCHEQQMHAMARELLEGCRDMVTQSDRGTIHVTFSMGIFVTADYQRPLDHLIEQADVALYEAKKNGRDQYVLSTDL
ncbi:GGDEF domain-containing protein [Marinicella sediminis]|uniref:diguanylate cyclase n=1 Tax=Marinicella sediminis TaxID=1792834 RepID=A0ABV7JBS2_9GAMM|nr:GGDEF domain-containing protein [Marinicella sediminis]